MKRFLDYLSRHPGLGLAGKTLLVAAACLAYSWWVHGMTREVFRVPMLYDISDLLPIFSFWLNLSDLGQIHSCDFLLISSFWQNIQDSGWTYSNPNLGAPFGAVWYDFPLVCVINFDALVMKGLMLLWPDPSISGGLYYIMLPVLTGVTAFWALRSLGTSDFLNMGLAMLYAFLPFYFMRGSMHFLLTTYQFVPLAFLLCIWGYRQEIFSSLAPGELLGNRKNWLAVLICLLIANNGNGYWPVFSCFFLLVAGLLAGCDGKRMRAVLPCIIPIGLVAFFFLLSLSPAIHYRAVHGKNPEAAVRIMSEPDIYGLKISQMLIPPYDIPGNTKTEERFQTYHAIAPLENENITAYLGLVGGIGFLILLLALFRRGEADLLDFLARLNISGVLLATVGGMATVLTVYFLPSTPLRGYNRISVFLAFLALAAVGLCLQRLHLRMASGKKAVLFRTAVLLLFLAGIAPAAPVVPHDFRSTEAVYTDHRQFISRIEAMLPKGAMVYQMPYCKFPEIGAVNTMPDYAHLLGVLHSHDLRWSYGGIKGREGDHWHMKVAELPLPERLRVLSAVGFEGIYIDLRAYKSEEWAALEGELRGLLQVEPMADASGNLVFFPMQDYNSRLQAGIPQEKREQIREELLRDPRPELLEGH